MSEGIEKKCINIEKKSINKTHSYSISIYIDGMGQIYFVCILKNYVLDRNRMHVSSASI